MSLTYHSLSVHAKLRVVKLSVGSQFEKTLGMDAATTGGTSFPPLPPEPPPPRVKTNACCQAACANAQAALNIAATSGVSMYVHSQSHESSPLQGFQPHQLPQLSQQLPAAQSWNTSGEWMPPPPPDTPPISTMLMSEAQAWMGLLQMHGNVLGMTKQLTVATTMEAENAILALDEQRDASNQREAAYAASLSNLVAQCDALVNEIVKIRGLRKVKHKVEQEAVADVLRQHSDEVLALGETLARNSALSIASATAELRGATTALRSQVTQARALLEAVRESATLRLPRGCSVVMGIRDGGGRETCMSAEALLAACYANAGKLNEESLAAALAGVHAGAKSGTGPAAGGTAPRTFVRRGADKSSATALTNYGDSGSGSGSGGLSVP